PPRRRRSSCCRLPVPTGCRARRSGCARHRRSSSGHSRSCRLPTEEHDAVGLSCRRSPQRRCRAGSVERRARTGRAGTAGTTLAAPPLAP
ncbi:hypothetical protein PENTCL1PPCAC_276, partial [Pristionchus entomophagus]